MHTGDGSIQSGRVTSCTQLSSHLGKEQEGPWACQGGCLSGELYMDKLGTLVSLPCL